MTQPDSTRQFEPAKREKAARSSQMHLMQPQEEEEDDDDEGTGGEAAVRHPSVRCRDAVHSASLHRSRSTVVATMNRFIAQDTKEFIYEEWQSSEGDREGGSSQQSSSDWHNGHISFACETVKK